MNKKDIEYWKQKPLEDILQQWHDCIKNGEVLLKRIDKALEYIDNCIGIEAKEELRRILNGE